MAFGSGPVSSGLDDILQKHHIRRQAYHGKTFTGNHVKKACQPEVIEDLAKHALDTVNSMNDHIPLSIFRTASEIKQKYTRILNNFADVHYVINTSNNLSDEEIEKADICIKEFMMSYRLLFPNSRISLKLHILEDHAMQQIRRFRAGLGRLNEQGGERAHKEQNREEAIHSNIQNPLQRLLAMMRAHHTTCCPEVQAKFQRGKKRKTEE
ncbi:uncharacterized protein [Amphiura filiformis]|uniref:uncharacterized protein n=1 Tax=Amphiura filiformis TaxID=82378 RepID=UPI003B22332E